ncbi:MAG TPA: phosphatase PAP2 family protein [Gemmatimonadales bacterium]|nr:phosphatase PAP2 family protein [Gemmatimonadales bacterium]
MASATTRRVGIGIAVGVVALCILGAITEDVVNNDPLVRFDVSVLETLHRHSTPTGVALFSLISRFGSATVLTILALSGVLFLAVRREWIVLGGWVAAFAGASLLDYWLKLAIHRPRPGYAGALIHSSWSFPSGHAMVSLVGYGMLAYVILLLRHSNRRTQLIVGGAAAFLIAAIGISRLYLGVHYFSDVIGGYAAGLVWLSACVSAVEIARRSRRRTLRLHPTS